MIGLAGFTAPFHPLSGISEVSDLAGFGAASALAHIELPILQVPKVTEIIGTR